MDSPTLISNRFASCSSSAGLLALDSLGLVSSRLSLVDLLQVIPVSVISSCSLVELPDRNLNVVISSFSDSFPPSRAGDENVYFSIPSGAVFLFSSAEIVSPAV